MFLIQKFQQFHAELVRLKARVAGGTWVFQGEDSVPAAESAGKESPTVVWRRLVSLLERQKVDASNQGGDVAVELYRGAQYAMVALADEIFLYTTWVGRESWRENLLEEKFFDSHRAGEEVFERIEKLLLDGDSLHAELGRIYLMVLALGFKGKYRSEADAEETLAGYRRRLYRFVFNHDPLALQGSEAVVPQAYEATLEEAVTTELPYLRPWLWAIVGTVLLWLGGSWGIWRYSTAQLEPLVERIYDVELHRQNLEEHQHTIEERVPTPEEAR
jgi:type VI secretion system protein ImpK